MLNNKKLIGILLGAIVMISLIAYTMANGSNNVVTSAVNNTGAWFGRVFSSPANGVVEFADEVDNILNTFEENQRLKSKIEQVDQLQVRIQDLETENEKMRQELKLSEVLSNFTTVNATVISRSPDQWTETLMINVGSDQGIAEDMAVMAGNGLIGRVIEVNPQSAKVLLLTSEQNAAGMVAARVQTEDDSSANGIISSYDPKTGHYLMTQIDPKANIRKEEMVISSGLGGVIPSSLLIGEVVSTHMDDYGLFRVAEIAPAGELTDIRFVTVVIREGRSE